LLCVPRVKEVAVDDFVCRSQRPIVRIGSFPKQVMVAVNGFAPGGGEITEAGALWGKFGINNQKVRYPQ
jgi:hypothetical protein